MNLIICLTPLQMFIAEKVIKKKNIKNNILVVIAYNDNDKFRYYYEKLSLLCEESYFFLIDNSTLLGRIFSMLKLKFFLPSINKNFFESCYLASIDCSYIQLITSSIKYNNLYTFDDGTINLLPNSSYYEDKNYSFSERIFRVLFGINDCVSLYRQKSKLHYTIFKNNRNIIDNTEFIPLVELKQQSHHVHDEIVKIFLGQPLSEINITKDKLIEFLVKEKIDYYYPHPREKEIIDNINYIDSNKIFEDYLVDYIEKNISVKIEVYTFFSTVILNIKDLKNIKVFSLYYKNLPIGINGVYEIFKDYNIEIRDFL